MNLAVEVRISVPFKAMATAARGVASVPSDPAWEEAFTRWGAAYSAFSRRRYFQFAKGGGNWAPLAMSTARRRRGFVGGRVVG